MRRAKACKLFSVLSRFDLGEPRKVYKTTFYGVLDKGGRPIGAASVSREIPPKAKPLEN
jgi:hypothetical protein